MALSCAPVTIFGFLVLGAVVPGTGGPSVPRRQPQRPRATGEVTDPYVIRHGPDLDLRRLHDGNKYKVVEVFYEPKELQSLLRHQHWTASLDATSWFIYGAAEPVGTRQ
jgi:hypothetical protein